jgi:uncharacterized protein YegJ (DUF2314 family)
MTAMRTRAMFLKALGLALLLGTRALSADENVVHRADQPDVVRVPAEDARMSGAIAEARRSVEEFIAVFSKPAQRQRSFAVKVPVIDGARVEHFWVDLESYANGQFTGRIANEPLDVHNVRLADRIVVDKERISDWMYVDRGRLVGGFTIRALRAGMSEEERKMFDASLPFEITERT